MLNDNVKTICMSINKKAEGMFVRQSTYGVVTITYRYLCSEWTLIVLA